MPFRPSWRPSTFTAFALPFLVLSGCSGTDIGYPLVSDTAACPDGGGASAASAGNATGAVPTTGGTQTEGAGSSTGGASGSGAVGGNVPTTPFTWPAAYDAAAAPMPADGRHNPGTNCMSSACHGMKVPFVFGGTVYQADGMTGAANVEVGISDGTLSLTAYSASNGNIWLPSSAGAINYSVAQIAIRSANGERLKGPTVGRGASCNGGGCHNASLRLIEP